MAQERKRVTGELASWQVCAIIASNGGKALNYERLNPYRPQQPDSPALARVKAASQAIYWRVIASGNRT